MDRFEPDTSLDGLTDQILEEMSRSGHNGQTKPDGISLNTDRKWILIDRNLEVAAAHADLVDSPPSMAHHRPSLRLLARFAAKIVLFLSKFVLVPQRCFNRATLEILLHLTNETKSTSHQLHSLLRSLNEANKELSDRIYTLKVSTDKTIDEVRNSMDNLAAHLARTIEKLNNQLPENLIADLAGIRTDLQVLNDKFKVREVEKKVFKEGQKLWEEAYPEFESRYRGSREEIIRRLKTHLPMLLSAGLGTEEMPVLDLGSGRGEWLEILRDAGLKSSGIESNKWMSKLTRGFKLDVIQGDAVEYLRNCPPESFGAVTGFHILEHLSPEISLLFCHLVFKALKPGGLVILETPNPERVEVGSFKFYLDPTHKKPIPSQMMHFMLDYCGFQQISIRGLHRGTPEEVKTKRPGEHRTEQLNEFLDYAISGWKPS